jgi:galactose mutarotase-like enzyme
MVGIASPYLSAAINPLGAELTSLKDADGGELMTDADPAFWAGHAPILFPIVGRLNGDVLRIDGREYPMKQHGFARRKIFAVVAHEAASATFRLSADEETRASYPFEFALEIAFTLREATLTVDVVVSNQGGTPMPASIGFHPAFAWPLPYGQSRGEHRITFDADDSGPIKRIADGLIAGDRPSPLDGRTLHLADDLFADDALVWDPVQSDSVTYGAETGPRLRIDFPDTPQLGIWTKPGARFVCVEPWHGHADPIGFTGDFRDKPGVFEVAPGGDWSCSMQVTLLA